MTGDWTGAIERAQAYAPHLSRGLDAQPDLARLLARGHGAEALAQARNAGQGSATVASALRREKQALALVLAIGDLAGAFPLSQVVSELSAFADRALDLAITDAVRARVPEAAPVGFIALALGKHGAQELNYSSDIDPILLYDPQSLPRRERDDPGDAAQRVARTLVQTMSHVDAEGYVFRVDLRLRPAAEVSPLAIPLNAALTHYESSALAWERAAFIRARACAGDMAAGDAFLAAIRAFVWRKSLDFGAIAEIGRLTQRIRANHHGPVRPGPGFNLKQGRGGIREIEFFAQTHQLIHGGRDPSLRLRGTRASLDALAGAGLIDQDEARLLGDSYDRLRTVEHRLQMVADQQTHALPINPAALDDVARLDGRPDGPALIAELTAITEAVGERYDRLIARHGGGQVGYGPPRSGQALIAEMARLGFPEPEVLAARIEGWRGGKLRVLRSEAARAAFDAVQPALLAAFAQAPEPLHALVRWEQLLGNLPSAVNLFRLLEARPGLTELLARILCLAPPLADALARRADLLDPLIDASAFELPLPVPQLAAQFAQGDPDDDYEALLDRVRRRVGEARFKLGVQLVEGTGDPMDVAQGLSRVAEAALDVLTHAAIAAFERIHGKVPGGALLIMGYGRLGGGALTHASDLDLVFLFTGDHAAESDGPRPLGATLYFNRLAQRVIAALSVPTAEGALYEVDTRLRPSGAQGPIAVSLDAFARYQRESAWAWEHMALARARVLHGPEPGRAELEEIVRAVLTMPRDPATLKAEVLEMRREMAKHKPARGPLDVKLARGGLVDVEFITHYLQLRGVGQGNERALSPSIPTALQELAKAGLAPETLFTAHGQLTRFLIAARLLAPDAQEPSGGARAVLAQATGSGDWPGQLAALAASRRAVAAVWHSLFDETLETD